MHRSMVPMSQLTIQASQLQYKNVTCIVVVGGGGGSGGGRCQHAEIISAIVTSRITSLIIFIASSL